MPTAVRYRPWRRRLPLRPEPLTLVEDVAVVVDARAETVFTVEVDKNSYPEALIAVRKVHATHPTNTPSCANSYSARASPFARVPPPD